MNTFKHFSNAGKTLPSKIKHQNEIARKTEDILIFRAIFLTLQFSFTFLFLSHSTQNITHFRHFLPLPIQFHPFPPFSTFLRFPCQLTSVQHLLHLNSVVVSSGVATSLLIFLIERLYEYFFPREKLEKKAEVHIEELLLIIFIPLGSIIIALRGMNHAFEDYLPESIILFAINGIVFYMYDALKKNEKQKIEKMQLQQQNLLYENQIQLQRESEEKMRMLRHDMKNHFYRMKTMVHQGEIPLLEEYMEHIISETESIVPICRTGNSDVDGIVNVKLTKAQREGTEIHLDLKIPTKLNIDSFDMNCILGNLFDNALEALSKVDKKILYFRMVYEKGVVNICLRNMFDGQLRVNEKNQLLSLKQDRKKCHGLGIKNVVETVKKYDGKFEYEQEKNVFSVYAMMYER